MLSPPVDNFKEPEPLFQVEKNKGKLSSNNKGITNFHFSHCVSIIVPDALVVPESLTQDFSTKTDYYKVTNFDISSIINKIFLKCFISNGKLTLLSINTRIDCDNTLAIIPNGDLILNLDRDTYLSFGIDGKVSHFAAKIKNRFVIRVNLKDIDLQNSKKKLEKLQAILKKLGYFTVILSWDPHEDDICPSSVAKYIYDLGHEITESHTDFKSNTAYSIKVPVIDLELAENDDILEFMEWLGMLSLEGDLEKDSLTDYVNSYVTPIPNIYLGQVKCLQWKGLFTSEQIQNLIEKFVSYNEQNDKPWISIFVLGFSDAPVSWGNDEHHFYTDGDNSYTIVFNKKNSLFCTYRCSRKCYK